MFSSILQITGKNLPTQNIRFILAPIFSLGLLVSASSLADDVPVQPPAGSPSASSHKVQQSDQVQPVGKVAGASKAKLHFAQKMIMQNNVEKLTVDLNLDQKQRQLYEDSMRLTLESMSAAGVMRRQIHDMASSDDYDEKKLRELIKNSQAELENNTVSVANAKNLFFKSLNTEQKKKMKTRGETTSERMQDFSVVDGAAFKHQIEMPNDKSAEEESAEEESEDVTTDKLP